MSPYAADLNELRADRGQTVVLIHGAIVSPIRGFEMTLLALRLRGLGYKVKTFCYPSIVGRMTRNSDEFSRYLNRLKADQVHIVAHSMGGVITKAAIEGGAEFAPGRIVALGSPFVDCWIGRRAKDFFGRWAIGETVHEYIGRDEERIWNGPREMGVVAGTYSFGIGNWFSTMPTPHDGVIAWEETRLKGIQDHFTLHINHLGLLLSEKSFFQIAHFLKNGRFLRTSVHAEELMVH